VRRAPPWQTAASIALFDPRISPFGKDINLIANIGGADRQDRENDDDLRHEGQSHLLNLGQRLKQGNDDADHHGCANGRPGDDEHRPHRLAHEFESVRFVHLQSIVTPVGKVKVEPSLKVAEVAALLPVFSVMVLPLLKVAVTPPLDDSVTDATVPVVVPSDELMV